MRGPVPKERIMQQFDTPAAITAVRSHITPAHRLAAKEAIADRG